MKRSTLSLLLAGALTAAIPAVASAQNINERQDRLFQRIDQGVRSGDLTRSEADRLRADFYALVRLEAQYRNSGGFLSDGERADLNNRFDALSERIRYERRDGDGWDRGGGAIQSRIARLTNTVERAIRNGWIAVNNRTYYRNQVRELARLEDRYSRDGLSAYEREELQRRASRLEFQLERESGREFGFNYDAGRYYR